MRRSTLLERSVRYACLATLAVFILFPVYYMIVTSLKSQREVFRNPGLWISEPTLANYAELARSGFPRSLLNSFVVAGGATVISLVVGVLAAYSLVCLRYRLRGTIRNALILAYLTPSALLFIPMAIIMSNLRQADTLHGLMLVYLSFTTPLATWLLMGFFSSLPPELEEQARVDGATRIQALYLVLIPLVRPGLVAVGIITFTSGWNEFLYALVLNLSPEAYTVPIAISHLISGDVYRWGEIMAGSVIASVPIMVLYYLGQRSVVDGLSTGAVKG